MTSSSPRFNMSTLRPCSICKEEFLGRSATVCPRCQKKKHDHKKWLKEKEANYKKFSKEGVWKSKTS